MSSRVNPPHWQPGPLGWAAVTVVGLIVSVQRMLQFRIGSDGWMAGVLLIGMVVAGFAVIEGVWVYAQREVAFVDSRVVVRRWVEVLLGRPGIDVPIDSGTRSTITLEGGRRLRIERDGATVVSMQLVYWAVDTVVELIGAFRAHGAELATPWDDGGSPR